MRRKKRPRVVWLPPALTDRLGTAPAVATNGGQSASFIFTVTTPPLSAPPVTTEIALVKDFANDGSGLVQVLTDLTLADIEDSGYRLRRIVGKIVILQAQDPVAVGPSIFKITAGIIVRRINDGGTSMAASAALGSPDIATTNLQNAADPWIWRRSWVLANNTAAGIALDPNAASVPGSNINYGGCMHESTHVDAKTARIIGPEERLFLDVTAEGLNGNSQDDPSFALVVGDLRVLGSMRTTVGNRRNSSR